MVTSFPAPTFLFANVPAALPVLRLTVSPAITPTRAALAVLSAAVVFPSYTLLFAVIPVTVRVLAVILAVAVTVSLAKV